MKIRPVGDRVVISPINKNEKSDGGLYLPETSQIELNEGEVTRVNDISKAPVSVGEHAVYASYGGTYLTVGGEKFLILDYKHIIAVLEDDDAV